jgi:hypothetical protein
VLQIKPLNRTVYACSLRRASQNFSDRIRMALFYDFVSLDLRSKFPQVDHPQVRKRSFFGAFLNLY